MVTNDIGESYARLSGHGFTPISLDGPQRLPEASGGVTAFKFRDPDGHPLELIQFPGPDRAVGIDHSAISVADAERSIAFYTGLGLSLGPHQVNTGPEQDRLDSLHQARVDVVALRPHAVASPHVELLGYQHPKGRAAPPGIPSSRLVLLVDETPDGAPSVTMYDPDGHELLLVIEGKGVLF
jgi:catechol 2,3-dioxygenase-like lactoylglutathione lyase family enzyme